MPLYDFKCSKCGLAFEVSRPISKASEPATCPNDGAEATRIFTMPMSFIKGGSARGSGDAGGEIDAPSLGHGDDHGHGHSHGPGGHVH